MFKRMTLLEMQQKRKEVKLPCAQTAIDAGMKVHTEHLGVKDKTRERRLEKAEKFDSSDLNCADDWKLRQQLGF